MSPLRGYEPPASKATDRAPSMLRRSVSPPLLSTALGHAQQPEQAPPAIAIVAGSGTFTTTVRSKERYALPPKLSVTKTAIAQDFWTSAGC